MTDIVPPPFTARMVRELKGAPLSCLILLMLAGQPVSNEWLCMMSGYTDKPVSQALRMLAGPEYQIAVRTAGGWRLSNAFQEILINRNISVPTTTTESINKQELNQSLVVVGRNFSDSLENPRYTENLETCRRLGIGEPSASKISNLIFPDGQPLTSDYIQAHIDSLGQGETRGLAIHRMLNHEPPPISQKQETEDEQRRRKYFCPYCNTYPCTCDDDEIEAVAAETEPA